MFLIFAVIGAVVCLFLDFGPEVPFYMKLGIGAVAGALIPTLLKYFLIELRNMILPGSVRRSLEKEDRRRFFKG